MKKFVFIFVSILILGILSQEDFWKNVEVEEEKDVKSEPIIDTKTDFESVEENTPPSESK